MRRLLLLLAGLLLGQAAIAQSAFTSGTIPVRERSRTLPKVSCSVRSHIPWRTASSLNANYKTARIADKTNVQCSNPRLYYWNGMSTYQGGQIHGTISGNTLHVNYVLYGNVRVGTYVGGNGVTVALITGVINQGDIAGNGGDFTIDGAAQSFPSDTAMNISGSTGNSFNPHGDVDVMTGSVMTFRCAIVQNLTGTGADQSATGVLSKCTWFEMNREPGFLAAGGSVSADGSTVTAPPGWLVHTDPLPITLRPQEHYFVQSEQMAANDSQHVATYGDGVQGALGDLTFGTTTPSSSTRVYALNFTSGTTTGQGIAPVAIVGDGAAGAKCVGLIGDSILHGMNGVTTSSMAPADADGVKGGIKTAVNAAGYCFVDESVSGVGMTAFNDIGTPSYWLHFKLFSLFTLGAVIDEMGHNDLAQLGYPWPGIAETAFRKWWTAIRASMGGAGRLVKLTQTPAATSANAAVGGTLTTWYWKAGGQYSYLNANKFVGGPGAPDAMLDIYAAVGNYDGTGYPNSTWSTDVSDGTHPTDNAHSTIAAYLTPDRLKAAFGF